MTPQECAVIMTYANQADPRIQLNDPTLDIWWTAMKHVTADEAKWGIKDYYANAHPNDNRGTPTLQPGTLRHRISEARERTAAKQRALEPAPRHKSPESYRGRNPELWEELVRKGADDHLADLQRRGIELTPEQRSGLAKTPTINPHAA